MNKKKLIEDEQKHLPDINDTIVKKLLHSSKNKAFPFDEDSQRNFNDLFERIKPENLRKAVLTLSLKLQESFKKSDGLDSMHDIAKQVLIVLQDYVSTHDGQLKVDFVNGKVQNATFENCFKIFVKQDPQRFSVILDQLFSIRYPENRSRNITICVHVKQLLSNPENYETGRKWVEIFKIDINKFNEKNGTYVDAIYDLWQESVKYTVNQIQNIYPKHSLDQYRTIIIKFFGRCNEKPLKPSVMTLISDVNEALKKKREKMKKEQKSKKNVLNDEIKARLEDPKFIREILMLIVEDYEFYVKDRGASSYANDFHQKVPNQLWNNCFEAIKGVDVNQSTSALDLLFRFSDPESSEREAIVTKHVQSLRNRDETYISGVHWTFNFNLRYLKCFDEYKIIVYKMHLLYKENAVLPLMKDYDKIKYLRVLRMACYAVEKQYAVSELAEKFINFMTVKKLNDILIAENYEQIKTKYGSSNPDEHNELVSKKIEDAARQTDNDHHRLGHALQMIDSEDTFKKGIDIFKNYEFSKLESYRCITKHTLRKYTNKIFCKSLIYKKGISTIGDLLKTSEDKMYYLRHLDNYCSRYKKDEFFNEDERQIKKLHTLEELLYIFHKLATKYKIEPEQHGFSAYHMLFYYSMKTVYDSWSDNIFGFCALHILKDNHYFCAPYNKCNLFEMIQEKQRYACCWAQYLKVEEQFLPSYLKSCECLKVCGHLNKVSKYLNAKQFYEIFSDDSEIKISCMALPFDNYEDFITSGNNFAKMISDSASFCGNEDSIIDCVFQGKKYKFITVQTSKGLRSFIDEYLSNLKIVGLDSETGIPKDQITVIQLSTEHWFCLIDVQEICKEISHEHPLWMKLFEIIFDENVIRV